MLNSITFLDFSAPNFWSLFFSIIFIPLIILLWNKRSKNGFGGIEIKLYPGFIRINEVPNPALDFVFTNNTDSVITIRNPKIIKCTTYFPINKPISTRDIKDNGFELKFLDEEDNYTIRAIDFAPRDSKRTSIALSSLANEDLITYYPSLFRRLVRFRKYFIIEFYLIQGNNWYHIKQSY